MLWSEFRTNRMISESVRLPLTSMVTCTMYIYLPNEAVNANAFFLHTDLHPPPCHTHIHTLSVLETNMMMYVYV